MSYFDDNEDFLIYGKRGGRMGEIADDYDYGYWEPDLEEISVSSLTARGEYKGHVLIQLLRGDADTKPFQFGLGKAKKTIQNLDLIMEFVDKHEGDYEDKEQSMLALKDRSIDDDRYPFEITLSQARLIIRDAEAIEQFIKEEEAKGGVS